ncbi:MAG: thymidylate kinase, partial [Caldiserica bacterium]|nr:thymidylate kinase [Caldisericota bacterium]
GRILSGRTSLKYFEAGMDMGFSDNIKESFKIFQGNVYQQYELLSKQYDFVVMDATLDIHQQQETMRKIFTGKIDLTNFPFKELR